MRKQITRDDAECQRILQEMRAAGKAAARSFMNTHRDTGACGFASVAIPTGERSLRKCDGSPFAIAASTLAWCGDYQSVEAHEAVARAMVASLRSNGVDATYTSRLD